MLTIYGDGAIGSYCEIYVIDSTLVKLKKGLVGPLFILGYFSLLQE